MSILQQFLFLIRKYVLVIAVLCLTILASCDNGNIAKESETPEVTINIGTVVRNYNETQEEILALIDNETNSSDLITQSYDIDLLIGKSYSGSLEEINKLAKIECIRKVNNLVYTIHRINEGGQLFIFYNFDEESKSWIIESNSWYYLKPLHKEDFNKVEVDKTTVDDIFKIDPTTVILPLNQGPGSKHIMSDYSNITIIYGGYSDNSKVIDIEYGVEPADSEYRKILDIDWPA